jgi:ADP-heptose:LPS heptosyltransferase
MTVHSMRRLDRWLGVPACLLLTAIRRVTEPFRARPAGPPRRIVFVKLAEQGSTVLAHQAICQAVARVGRTNVFFLAFEENRFIVDVMGQIPPENVLSIRTSGLAAAVWSALRVIGRLRQEGVDTAIDFEFFARSSAALCYLSGARRRIGFHAFGGEAAWRADLMTHRLSYNPHLHTSQCFAVMVAAMDADPAELPALDVPRCDAETGLPEWRPPAGDLESVRGMILRETGGQEVPPIVLLNANCSDLLPLRRWPAERYVELAGDLLQRYPDLRVVFTGAPAEAAEARRLKESVGSERCITLAGRTTLGQLLALYTLSRVLVTNDSGPAHFAALTPVHVVTLFGPETPALYAPRSPRSHVLWAALPCSPCVSAYNGRLSGCRNNLCMQGISVSQVLQAVSAILEGTSAAAGGR